jgi:hypothetical protein
MSTNCIPCRYAIMLRSIYLEGTARYLAISCLIFASAPAAKHVQ